MKQNLKIAILMTIVTTVLLGVIYPLVVTGLAQVMFHDKANGQLIRAQTGRLSVRELSARDSARRDTCIRGPRLQAMGMTPPTQTARSTVRLTRS